MSLHQSKALAKWLNGEHTGPEGSWKSVASIDRSGPDDLTFAVGNAEPSSAAVVLCSTPFDGHTCIVVDDPKLAFILTLNEAFHVEHADTSEVDSSATIHRGAVIMGGCSVGARTTVYPNAVLYPGTSVGTDCIIHAGAVIGADGFGFHPTHAGPVKVPHLGGVEIGDRVEIGANATVDRGFLADTTIGSDTKIDNHVHIGHNCCIGSGVVIAAQTGLSGSVTVEDGALIGGQVGIVEHTRIGRGAQIGAQSGVSKDVASGQRVLGTPANEAMATKRSYAALRRLAQRGSNTD